MILKKLRLKNLCYLKSTIFISYVSRYNPCFRKKKKKIIFNNLIINIYKSMNILPKEDKIIKIKLCIKPSYTS